MRPFQHPPAAVWDIFRTVVEPWFAQTAGVPAPAGGDDALWHLYCWATSIVSAYSFELGSSRLQVRLWTLPPTSMIDLLAPANTVPKLLLDCMLACMTANACCTESELPFSTHRGAGCGSCRGYKSPVR